VSQVPIVVKPLQASVKLASVAAVPIVGKPTDLPHVDALVVSPTDRTSFPPTYAGARPLCTLTPPEEGAALPLRAPAYAR